MTAKVDKIHDISHPKPQENKPPPSVFSDFLRISRSHAFGNQKYRKNFNVSLIFENMNLCKF